MKRINVLPKSVYNRIAAGEVVDRPYSVVKELVENSIDAGATEIEIKIESGGKQLISVTDNGGGIYKDDLPSAFLPHATSKVSKFEDLEMLTTLGFRGEALSSISAVAKVEIVSVVAGNPAYKLECNGGEMGEVQPAAIEKGTCVTVRNLFYNVPAREKFLKAESKEKLDITNFVSRFILSNPQISFKYYVDGKIVLQSYGGGLEEAVAQVYGAKTISQCIKIDAKTDKVRIYGYIGNQNFFKPNKSYQSAFLNGRYVVNNTIATAISNAYASYAMKKQFPFYVVNIEMPPEYIDVNVHPSKADVRFLDSRMVFGAIYKVISSVLDGTASAAEFVVDTKRVPEIKSSTPENSSLIYSENKSDNEEDEEGNESTNEIPKELIEKYKPEPNAYYPENEPEVKASVSRIKTRIDNLETPRPVPDYNQTEEELRTYGKMQLDNLPFYVSDPLLDPRSYQYMTHEEVVSKNVKKIQEYLQYDDRCFRGVLFNTYLLYEHHNVIFIIDQHAAHERLIYDSLKEKLSKRAVNKQPLITPFFFDVNFDENDFLEKNLKVLTDFGFDISKFSRLMFRVDAIPADLKDINMKNFFDEVLSQMNSYNELNMEELFKDKLAMTACKHAVKGGMRLTDREVEKLFKMLHGNMGLKCPHGRPICATLSKYEIEKMFKRV